MSNQFNTDGMLTIPEIKMSKMNCLESIECTIAFDVRDWSTDRRSAWIYGIVFGWNDADESDESIKQKFHWDNNDIERLKKYHEEWVKVKEKMERSSQFYNDEWISVSERLPENEDDVLVWDGCNRMVAWYMDDEWHSLDRCFKPGLPIKYWMPLPYYPKEGE